MNPGKNIFRAAANRWILQEKFDFPAGRRHDALALWGSLNTWDEAGMPAWRGQGVAGTKQAASKQMGRVTACFPSFPELGSATFHWLICRRGVREIHLLILPSASLFSGCNLPIISRYRLYLPLYSCFLYFLFLLTKCCSQRLMLRLSFLH